MKGKILVTDSLFIFKEHEEALQNVGYEIERLDKPQATEEELVAAVKGKIGYILGGIEKITDKVIEAADELEAICFTGSDWRYFIPGYESATKKGIAIVNAPGANSGAVSEYTLALMLAMTREIFDLGRTGDKTFKTTKSVLDSTVGLIGMGHIGKKVARMLRGIGVPRVVYYSRTRLPEIEKEIGIEYLSSIDEIVQASDIISLHTSKEAGVGYFDKKYLSHMKDEGLLINCSFETAINLDDLYTELSSGRLRCAHDGAVADERFKSLPLYNWFNSNAHSAYNTFQATKAGSDMATESMINLLATGKDQYKVN